jgi:hypothetical protein
VSWEVPWEVPSVVAAAPELSSVAPSVAALESSPVAAARE